MDGRWSPQVHSPTSSILEHFEQNHIGNERLMLISAIILDDKISIKLTIRMISLTSTLH